MGDTASTGKLSEFDLIERFFTRARSELAVNLGIGDDCALLAPLPGHQLAISTDMLVVGRHFFADVAPRALGHKALAVNLSDLAAMGAKPRAFMLALALPEVNEAWLSQFSAGLFALALRYNCKLIGGDTTAGPLNLCVTIFGDIEVGHALTRDAAKVNDDIWVSGALGDARLALGVLRDEWTVAAVDWPDLRRALEWPQPRIELGLALKGIATAAIDISDGLSGDLAHIVRRSNVTATVDVDKLPRSKVLAQQPLHVQQRCTIAGGDDYELCFTAAESKRDAIHALSKRLSLRLTRIGKITADCANMPATADRIVWHDAHGARLTESFRSFDHFNAS